MLIDEVHRALRQGLLNLLDELLVCDVAVLRIRTDLLRSSLRASALLATIFAPFVFVIGMRDPLLGNAIQIGLMFANLLADGLTLMLQLALHSAKLGIGVLEAPGNIRAERAQHVDDVLMLVLDGGAHSAELSLQSVLTLDDTTLGRGVALGVALDTLCARSQSVWLTSRGVEVPELQELLSQRSDLLGLTYLGSSSPLL